MIVHINGQFCFVFLLIYTGCQQKRVLILTTFLILESVKWTKSFVHLTNFLFLIIKKLLILVPTQFHEQRI